MEKVCIMGLGYIGLPTASILASKGFFVHGVDINPDIVNLINESKIHIYEPELDILVKAGIQSGKLKASIEPERSDIFIISVPTPFKEDYIPDTSYIQAATKAIAQYIQPGNLIILESTSPVGSTEEIAKLIADLRPDLVIPKGTTDTLSIGQEQIYIAHCPERVLPGQIIRELVENDRIIGGIDQLSSEKAKSFYQKFVSSEIILTDARTAELAKLTENAFRDVNIAFANELSLICDNLSIDVWELIELANRHPRVNILSPGPGVGGHCIAIDPWFIINSSPEQSTLIKTARIVNDNKPNFVVEKVKEKAKNLKEPIICCLGLSYKANIDDLRESPAMKIVKKLAVEKIGQIIVVEPHIREMPVELIEFQSVNFLSFTEACEQADIIVLLVDHDVFKTANKSMLKEKILIDTRGIW